MPVEAETLAFRMAAKYKTSEINSGCMDVLVGRTEFNNVAFMTELQATVEGFKM